MNANPEHDPDPDYGFGSWKADEKCKVPPPGWYCTREAGHKGPCAAWPDDSPVLGYFRDDGTQGEDITGIPNGFREHVEKVARGEADIETLLPNWSYIRRTVKP